MKRKVLHIINSLTPGGAETLLVNSLTEGGLQENIDNVFVYFQVTSELRERMDKKVKIIFLNYKGIWDLPRVLIKLRKIIKENDIDIVHSHLNPAGFYTHLACPSGVPQVHTVHTTYSMDNETSRYKRFLEKVLYFNRKNCNVILLSGFTKQDFLKSIPFKGRAFVLNNFVPDAFFRPVAKVYQADKEELRLVAVGRLSKVKNFQYLLEVFKHLKGKKVYLDIYGSGDKQPFEKKIRDWGLNIRLMGSCNNTTKIYEQYDLFILPSVFEGFPLTVFEAMASGVPVVLSAIAPLKNIVKDNGVYFPLDDAKAVAELLVGILNKKTDINAVAKKALEFADQTVRRDIYIKKLISIYEQLCSG